TQIAAVVISNAFPFERPAFFYADLAIVDELLQKSGMMQDLIMAAQLGIFVAKDIEAMRTGGNDLFDAVIIQQLDILIGHHLKKELIAGPACGITRTGLLLAQNGITNAC